MTSIIETLVTSFDEGAGWQLLSTPFMRNAFIVGTMVAIAAGAVGYFVLLRGLPFATHAVAHIGFPGATLAALVGWPPALGLAGACIVGGGAIGAMTRRIEDREIVTGTVLAFASGLGILFNSLGSGQSGMITSILFGNVLSVSEAQILWFSVAMVICLGVLAAIGRPLFFASIDPDVAAAKGVRVSLLGGVFLVLMSLVVAAAVTIVGVLLIFALLVTPAAAATHVTARPGAVVACAIAIALGAVWIGLIVAMFIPWPPSFVITSVACATWLTLSVARRPSRRSGRLPRVGP